ncbi:MAG: hypothetical protein AB7R89_16060 [Dehalococcoidia bacterium]
MTNFQYPIALQVRVGPVIDETVVEAAVRNLEKGTRHDPRWEKWGELVAHRALSISGVFTVGDAEVSFSTSQSGEVHLRLTTPYGSQLLQYDPHGKRSMDEALRATRGEQA